MPDIAYHGGPVVANPLVETVYYGDYWSSHANEVDQIDTFFGYLVTSPYFDLLSQYNVGHGRTQTYDLVTKSLPSNVSLDSVVNDLAAEINAGRVIANSGSVVYNIMVEPGVLVDSSYPAFHTARSYRGQPLYFAVDAGVTESTPQARFDEYTRFASHELAETVTDPDPNNRAWNDSQALDQGQSEIGDNGSTSYLSGYYVQDLWSIRDNAVGPMSPPIIASSRTDASDSWAYENLPFHEELHFTQPGTHTAADFQTIISWGDGESSAAVVSADGAGGFVATGTHRYRTANQTGRRIVTFNGLQGIWAALDVRDAPLLAGTQAEYAVPTAGSTLEQAAAGPDGNVWFAETANGANRIGRVTPAGAVTEFPVPTANSQPYGVTAGPDGNLWFTEFIGNKVGRITPAGVITEFALPAPNSQPLEVKTGPDGNLWFVEYAANQVGRITPAGAVTAFPLPAGAGNPGPLVVGPDGNLWFPERNASFVGRVTPAGVITQFPAAEANGIAVGPDGNLWLTGATGQQWIGQVTPSGQAVSFALTGYRKPLPRFIRRGPDGSLWFTEGAANAIAHIVPDVRPLTAVAGQAPFGQLTSFFDGDPIQAGSFTATVDWGDGNSSVVSVFSNSPGFVVNTLGDHAYAAEGRYAVSIKVTDKNGGAAVTVNTLAHVARTGPPPSGLPVVANALSHGAEYYSNFITAAYGRYLGRRPDGAGLAAWVTAMQNGLTDERLEAGFIGSGEHIQNHGGPGAGWVRGMYQNLLGRTPSQAEVDAWVSALNSGAATPTQAAYGFAAGAEREGQRVTADYVNFLGRAPGAGEVNSWVQAFLRGVRNEDVVAGFVGSAEYFQRHYDDIPDWLYSAYPDLLGRPPDDAGYQAWLTFLKGT